MPQNTESSTKAARLRRGWTLRDLADQCSEKGVQVDFGQLGRIERGECTPRPRLRAVLADVLKVDVAEIGRAREVASR
jgi:transcriptional regulator with XRE-family HTH domain